MKDALRCCGLLLVGAALLAMATWPLWALLYVARAVLVVAGAWLVCDALGALCAKAGNAHDE